MNIIFGKEEKTAILLLLAVITVSCVLFLLSDTLGKESFASPYGPSSKEGDLVIFEGPADEIIYTKTGGHIIVNSGNTSIFIRNGAVSGIIQGPDMAIRAVGTIENYEGEMEIYVSDPSGAVFINRTSGD